MHPVSFAAFFTVILILAACSFSFENCRSLNREVRGICLYYNDTTDDDDYLSHINKDTIIFHLSPLFYSKCSMLSRIFVCSTLFPFCSTRHSIILLPCQQVCFSVFTACNHVLTAHHQQWLDFLNCSSYPSPQHLCLQPSQFINQPLSSSPSSSLLSTPTVPSSTSSLPSNFTSRLSTPITSSVSITDSFYFVTVAPLLLVVFLFGFFFLYYVFRFQPLPQSDPITTETFALSPITPSSLPESSSPPLLSLPDVPPPAPQPPQLPPEDLPTYQNTGTLYAIATLY